MEIKVGKDGMLQCPCGSTDFRFASDLSDPLDLIPICVEDGRRNIWLSEDEVVIKRKTHKKLTGGK
jgi:hypothetical protein